MTPEAAPRQKIDEFLVAAGWPIQNYRIFSQRSDEVLAA
jgi:hypothetical protein